MHGEWFATTILPFSYLAEHLSPLLVIASPVFLVWHDAEAFLLLQSLAIGASGIGIFLVARLRSGDSVAALLLQAALTLAPSTGFVARDEFHPIALAMPFLTFAMAFLWSGRIRGATLIGAGALLINEDAALVTAPLGLLIAWWERRLGRAPFWGLGLASLSLVWLLGYFLLVVPHMRPSDLNEPLPHPDLRQFVQCGESVEQVFRCLLDPGQIISRGTTNGDREAIKSLFGPTLGLGLLGPSFLVLIPRWLVLLLGLDPPLFQALSRTLGS